MNEPKQITYIEREHQHPVSKTEFVTIREIYELTDDPKEASCYVIGATSGWAKLVRREIVDNSRLNLVIRPMPGKVINIELK